jgi:MFS family permease
MQYLQEFREKWRSWVGAALGLSVGAATNAYTSGLFAPHMIAEFGWSRAVFALHGTLTIAMFLLIPVVGRLTDLFGSRNVAAIGVLAICRLQPANW